MLTPEKIDAIFAKRREKQDEINKKIDLAIEANNNSAIKLYLDELIAVTTQPISFE